MSFRADFARSYKYRGILASDRFWSKVNKTPDCWIWTGWKNWFGYGMLGVAGMHIVAHRMAYLLSVGDIPFGMSVLHTCDNPGCVNPAHFFLGTYSDNLRDAMRKGRWVALKGEGVGTSKLNANQVKEIRVRFSETGNKSLVAREFSLSDTMVRYIVERRSWKHI